MKKQILATTLLLFTFVQSCNFGNTSNKINKNDLMTPADYKITNKKEPEKLTFSTKATIQGLANVFKLPEGKNTKIELTTEKVEKDDDKEKIKIPKVGEFKVIFKKGSKYKVLDNNANDGVAVIEMPEAVMEGFLKLTDEGESKSINKITMEDKLYYTKQELSVLSPKNGNDDKFKTKDSKENEKKDSDKKESDKKESENEKDKWYKIGKKPFPVPTEWYSDNGNDYVLSFNNNGIKKLEFRWFKSDKADFPSGINEITPEAVGIVELAGVGKMEVPAGAVTKKTVMVMKEEKEVSEILYDTSKILGDPSTLEGKREFDFIAPVVKLYPFGLNLNKPATVFLETNATRLGRNEASVIQWHNSDNKSNWDFLSFKNYTDDIKAWTLDKPTEISTLNYITKLIDADMKESNNFSSVKSIPVTYDENNFNTFSIKNDIGEIITPGGIFTIQYDKDSFSETQVLGKLGRRLERAYTYFLDVPNTPKDVSIPKIYNGTILSIVKRKGSLDTGTGAYTDNNSKGRFASRMVFPNLDFGAEHELWHVFQNAKYGEFSDSLERRWKVESTADHMGAKAFRILESKKTNLPDSESYSAFLSEGLNRLGNIEGKPKVNGVSYSQNMSLVVTEDEFNEDERKVYSAVGYFTFIDNTKDGGEMMPFLQDEVTIKDFHNYAYYAYTKEKFNIFPILYGNEINTKDKELSSLNTPNKPYIEELPKIPNHGVNYRKFKVNVDKKTTIGFRVIENKNSTDCQNDSTNIRFQKYYNGFANGIFKDNKLLDMKSKWVCFKDITKDDEILLIISNSNGIVSQKYDCKYKLLASISCKECK